jgi:transcription elongation factor Elf1
VSTYIMDDTIDDILHNIFVSDLIRTNRIKNRDVRTKYKCPRCGHITTSHTTKVHSHSSRKCGAVGCQRSLSRRHIVE